MFNPVVTPFDLVSNAHRTLASLAELGDVPIQRLRVSATRAASEQIDSDELAATADDPGVTPQSCVIQSGGGLAIAGSVNNLHGSRPVMATTAKSPGVHRGLGTVTKTVFARTDAPVAADRDRSGVVALPILRGVHR